MGRQVHPRQKSTLSDARASQILSALRRTTAVYRDVVVRLVCVLMLTCSDMISVAWVGGRAGATTASGGRLVAALAGLSPPNLGVVGPVCHGADGDGPPAPALDFTHRTHGLVFPVTSRPSRSVKMVYK